MWDRAIMYLSLYEACQILKEEKLRFGDPRHIAAKNKVKAVRSNSNAYDRNLVNGVTRFLKEKYGAKPCETSATF